MGAPNSHSSHHPHNIRKNLLSVISTTKADSRYSDNFTTKHTSISHIRAEHTPDPRLSLSGPSHNISQYLRRFPSYDLQLTTYDFPALLCWDLLPPTTTSSLSVQSLSAASQHLRRFPSYDLRLPSWDPPPPYRLPKKTANTKHTPAPLGLCVLGDVRSPPPPVSQSQQPASQ